MTPNKDGSTSSNTTTATPQECVKDIEDVFKDTINKNNNDGNITTVKIHTRRRTKNGNDKSYTTS